MKIFNLVLLIFCISTAFSACGHRPLNSKLSNDWTPLSLGKQKRLVRRQTKSHKEYEGLHLEYEAELTFLNQAVQSNNLKIASQFKNWTPTEAQEQKEKHQTKLSENSEFFLIFYTPKVKRNKLNQKASDWKAVLKVNNEEFEGKIKLQENRSHHNKIYYPDINPWSTPYLISFPVATNTLENNTFNVLIVGPEGMATFKYK